MGPQLVRCGKVREVFTPQLRESLLQWGRNLFVAESVCRIPKPAKVYMLQWGRNLFVAERL